MKQIKEKVSIIAQKVSGKTQPETNVIKEEKKSIPIEKPKPVISGLNIFGYILIIAGAGGIGTGYYFDTLAVNNFNEAKTDYMAYTNATSDSGSKWNAYKSKLDETAQDLNIRNICYISGGISAGLGIIFALIPSNFGQNTGIIILPNYFAFRYKF